VVRPSDVLAVKPEPIGTELLQLERLVLLVFHIIVFDPFLNACLRLRILLGMDDVLLQFCFMLMGTQTLRLLGQVGVSVLPGK
jgi:hypothetical protein